MKTILQRQVALATAHGPRWVSSRPAHVLAAIIFALLILGPMALGVCGCTMTALGSLVMIVATALLVGNSAITALAEEREKKTLVFLRLTLLSAPQVLLLKMVPEFLILRSVLTITAPVVLLAALLDHGLGQGIFDVALAACTGVFAAATGVFLSTMFQSKSKAVVGGWIFKAVWLLLAPLFDTVLAAVTVQNTPPPVFMALDPLAGWWFSTVPEAAAGSEALLPLLTLPALLGVSAILVLVAARRFDASLIVGNLVGEEQIHPLYEHGWGPVWLQRRLPVLRHNPLFLRELVQQMRGGAGRWPGYAVFAVLFLAPFMYARLWATKDIEAPTPVPPSHMSVAQVSGWTPGQLPGTAEPVPAFTSSEGIRLVLVGHTHTLCLRTLLNQAFDIPLPAHQLREERFAQAAATTYPAGPDDTYVAPSALHVDPQAVPPTTDVDMNVINQSSLAWGLMGAVFMLLIYVGIRCSGFLATAVTGERDRRSWEDLALTALHPAEAMGGRAVGSLLLPMVQMTATFPLMLFFVFNGSISVVEVGFLYLYTVALAVAAGLLGLWSSAVSQTSHESHARALLLGVVAFVIVPALMPLSAVLAVVALVRGMVGLTSGTGLRPTAAWMTLALALVLTPSAASPMSAVLSFMPSLHVSGSSLLHWLGGPDAPHPFVGFAGSMAAMVSFSLLLWHDVVARLHETDQDTTLRAQFAGATV